MAVTRANVWIANDILTAVDLNAEFNNIIGANGQAVGFPRTSNADFDGYTLLLDANADTTMRADTDDQIDFAIGGTDTIKFTANGITILGRRVLTTTDRAEIRYTLARIGTLEARVNEISNPLLGQLDNF
jgi:hypothetical protein